MKAIINLRLAIVAIASKGIGLLTLLDNELKKSESKQKISSIDSISSCKISDLEIIVTVGVTLGDKTKETLALEETLASVEDDLELLDVELETTKEKLEESGKELSDVQKNFEKLMADLVEASDELKVAKKETTATKKELTKANKELKLLKNAK